MKRGYQALFGGGDKKERWFRRIFGELKLFRRDESVFNRAANRSLHNIEDNPGGSNNAGSGILGVITGIIGKVLNPIGGIIIRVLSPIGGLVLSALRGIGAMILPAIGTVLSFVFSPIGLAIGAAALLAWGLFTEDGRKFFASVGEYISGAWDTSIGFIKENFQPVFDAGIALWDWVAKAFEPAINTATDLFDGLKTTWKGITDGIKDIFNTFSKFLKDKFGIDIPAIVEAVVQPIEVVVDATKTLAKDAGSKAWEGAKNIGGKVAESAKSAGSKAWEGIKDAGNWALGKTSKMFESGKGGAGTISSGAGDHGGASYGTYQLSSKQGKVDDFLSKSKYGKDFEGLKVGLKDFDSKWKETAKNDPEFEAAQHDYIKKEHFDPPHEKLQKAGIDLTGRGKSVQDSIWSTSVQFGANSSLIQKALKNKDVAKMSDKDIVSSIQDYKIENNDALFSKSDSKVRAGTLNRAKKEKDQLTTLADVPTNQSPPQLASATLPVPLSAPPSTISISSTIPTSPKIPTAPAIADSPGVIVPMASNTEQRPSANTQSSDVGRDLKDRRLAHIVTGGFSGPG